uniref:Pox virus entry-fusion-complex G9/A16 n=1 Tax=Panulirus argus virus 1 TaxID=380624 RepID=A0A6G9HEI3_9VIRU|nr:Pox virus entry-fusion-complex G9/A16 [Panulirus argus virus 1]
MAAPLQIRASENNELNKSFTLQNFCAPAGTVGGYVANYIDKAGEYAYVGEGSTCRYCSLAAPRRVNCAAGCADISCCAIIGKTARFARTTYKGDKEKCCMGGPRIDSDGRTCHPDHVPNSEECRTVLLNNCNNDLEKYLVRGHACNNYATFFPEGMFLKCKACNEYDIFTKHEALCKTLCLQNPGLCDDASNVYCNSAEGRDSTYCSCINDTSLNNPICASATCRTLGYITNGIKDRDCIINNCKVDLSFDNIRTLDINQLEIQQQCGVPEDNGDESGGDGSQQGMLQQQQQQHPLARFTDPLLDGIPDGVRDFFSNNAPFIVGGLLIILLLVAFN